MAARRDSSATSARILSAACAEFSAAGYAGARVERIARAAGCNIRMIYAYFGGKSELFDASYRHTMSMMTAEVPPRPDDLAGWAGDLVDYHSRSPEALRINMWAQLERPEVASEQLEEYAAKIAATSVTDAAPLGNVDLLVLIYAIAQAWQIAPRGLIGGDEHAARSVEAQKAAAVTAVARILRRGT